MSTETQSAADLQACVAMMQGGSKTFFAASRLLPMRVRAAAIALYAFCRVADDLVDQGGDAQANFDLGREYEDMGQTGAAISFYLRTAERAQTVQLQYESLLRMALCFGKQWRKN